MKRLIVSATAFCILTSTTTAQAAQVTGKRFGHQVQPAGTLAASDGTRLAVMLNSSGYASSAFGRSKSGKQYSVSVPVAIGQGPITFNSSESAPITFTFAPDGSSLTVASTAQTLTFQISQKWKPPAGGTGAPIIMKIYSNGQLKSDSEYTTGPAVKTILKEIETFFPTLPAEMEYFRPFFAAYGSEFDPSVVNSKVSMKIHWGTVFGAGVAAFECGLLSAVAGIPTAGTAVPLTLMLCVASTMGAAIIAGASSDSGHSGGNGDTSAPTGQGNPGTGDSKPIIKDETPRS